MWLPISVNLSFSWSEVLHTYSIYLVSLGLGFSQTFNSQKCSRTTLKVLSWELDCVPYVSTNRSPSTCVQLHEHLEILPLTKRGRIRGQAFRLTPSPLVYKVLWGRHCVVFIFANPDPGMVPSTEKALN